MAAPQTNPQVNNAVYETYGDRWYTAYDDPVAILRASTRVKVPWILGRLPIGEVLDVACGAGFVSNALSRAGFSVTGLDLSPESLATARRWDVTGRVRYIPGDARSLPFPDACFAAVTVMDFLEHVESPQRVIRECARVLRPGGRLFFSTLNRNFVSWLVGIKLVEWLVRRTPPHLHVHRLFLKPKEVTAFCRQSGLVPRETVGLRPRLSSIPARSLLSGIVPESLEFQVTPSTMLLYMGMADKPRFTF